MSIAFKIHEKILPTAALPFKIVKGSVPERNSKAETYFQQFYGRLAPACSEKSCSVENIRSAIEKTLAPNKINVDFFKEENPNYGGSLGTVAKFIPNNAGGMFINHSGYKFLLKQNYTAPNSINKYTAFHEARHFFDRLFNPKKNMLRCNGEVNHLGEKSGGDTLYGIFLSKQDNKGGMNEFKKTANLMIKSLPDDVLTDTLQSIRAALSGEISAYNAEIQCLIKDNKYADALKLKMFLIKNCKFKSKLKFANEQLKDVLARQREVLHKENGSTAAVYKTTPSYNSRFM